MEKPGSELTDSLSEVLPAAMWMRALQLDLERGDGREQVLAGTCSHGCHALA